MTRAPRHRVVILGAGRGVSGPLPSAMVSVDERGRVLDWLLAAFEALPAPQVHFVGGYRADAVVAQYPHIRFSLNPDWEVTGPAGSLALVPLSAGISSFVSYADVLFRPDAVRAMERREADVVLAVDSHWRVRYDGRSRAELASAEKVVLEGDALVDVGKHVSTAEASAEFAGLMKLSAATAARLERALGAGVLRGRAGIPEVVQHLAREGAAIAVVDVAGEWAELNAPQDLARFVLGTKAESLERLRPLLRSGEIGEMVAFTAARWDAERAAVLARIQGAFSDRSLIVRSSARGEDGWLSSSAGVHESVAGVPADDGDALTAAVDRVIASYRDADPGNQVLVQEMLADVALSGVLMTRTPSLGAPYFVVNFDDRSARTDSVTAGTGEALRTLFVHRGAPLRPDLPPALHRLLEIARELERLVGHDSLDVEFAFDRAGRGHVLQVRPISVSSAAQPRDDETLAAGIEDALRLFRELQQPSPFLVGSSTGFSVMADWNPAEMIGTAPGALALSLYRTLISDETWARQRAEYGYRDVRPHALIVDFLGRPYVDLRVDFNSFVPAALPDALAARLVDHQLEQLRGAPALHDKVEFEILFTCLGFDFDERAERLRAAGFTDAEVEQLRAGLREITRAGIARCQPDLAALEAFARRTAALCAAPLPPLARALALLDDARRLGVPAFAHLARGAFAAVALLRSLAARGGVSEKDVDAFLATLRTVPSAMQEDAAAVASGALAWEALLERYGHLRPGSYDITSPRYASAPEEFLRPLLRDAGARRRPPGQTPWSSATRDAVRAELARIELGVDLESFERFARSAIEGREFAKLHFTRNLSEALEALAEYGAGHGVGREELAHVPLHELLALRGARAQDAGSTLRRLAHAGREASYATQAVCLPAVLLRESDFTCFEQLEAEANYVTRKVVRAELVTLSGVGPPAVDLEGKIVAIRSADPGFDWLFSRGIGGLVTMYGGVNSHMAIRAAEFELPAAIGLGELRYGAIADAEVIELDCASRQIHVVR